MLSEGLVAKENLSHSSLAFKESLYNAAGRLLQLAQVVKKGIVSLSQLPLEIIDFFPRLNWKKTVCLAAACGLILTGCGGTSEAEESKYSLPNGEYFQVNRVRIDGKYVDNTFLYAYHTHQEEIGTKGYVDLTLLCDDATDPSLPPKRVPISPREKRTSAFGATKDIVQLYLNTNPLSSIVFQQDICDGTISVEPTESVP